MKVEKIHFIGICGTLMGNIAVCLSEQGYQIEGSDDKFYPPMSDLLACSGLKLYTDFAAGNLDWDPDLIVVGNAISRGNPEVERVLSEKLNFISLPELIRKYLLTGKEVIAVSGTHGKTTTTTLLAKSLHFLENGSSYVIGGVPQGDNSGFKYTSQSRFFTIEADEYDTSFFDKRSKFIHYFPDYLIINNIEFDHGDIFRDLTDVNRTFSHLVKTISADGYIIANGDNKNVLEVIKEAPCKVITFGLGNNNKARITKIKYHPDQDKTSFAIELEDDIHSGKNCTFKFQLPFCGEYQIFNYSASFLVLYYCGFTPEQIRGAFTKFKGVKRRHQLRGEINKAPVIEDFAHHPTAIKVVLQELKQKFPGKKILAVFEPRSNTTRRNIFFNELLEAFQLADKTILGKINREELLREEEKLNIPDLLKELQTENKEAFYLPDVLDIAHEIKKTVSADWVVLIMTNGSFDGLIEKWLSL